MASSASKTSPGKAYRPPRMKASGRSSTISLRPISTTRYAVPPDGSARAAQVAPSSPDASPRAARSTTVGAGVVRKASSSASSGAGGAKRWSASSTANGAPASASFACRIASPSPRKTGCGTNSRSSGPGYCRAAASSTGLCGLVTMTARMSPASAISSSAW